MKESRYNIAVRRGAAVYVYNGASGALLRIPSRDYRAMRRFVAGEDRACSVSVLEQMVRGGMLISDDRDEVEHLRSRYLASRRDRTNFALTIVTSLGCNFSCPYCFEDKRPSIVNAETEACILSVLDDQLSFIKAFHVTWFGGEPLVGKRALLSLADAFMTRCDRAGVSYGSDIITNGYLLDEQTCRQLRDHRVASAQITIDGPPDVHDRMRPLNGGGQTFRRIVDNLHHAIRYLDVSIRMNVDVENVGRLEELLEILKAEGLAGKVSVGLGQLVNVSDGAAAPSATYKTCCLNRASFAQAELQFDELASRHGFGVANLPGPSGAPCTAVRENELVVGSGGELYKCWDSVGNSREVIGHIRDYRQLNGRLHKWLSYDPFANDECRSCIALPVCMGGCAHHALDSAQYENRCGTFRHTHRERVLAFVESAERGGEAQPVTIVKAPRRMETH